MNLMIGKKLAMALVLVFFSTCLISQTAEQAKLFLSRTTTAVYKVQKEILKQSVTNIDAAFKKAVKYQVVAVKLYQQNKYAEAVGYSYKARVQTLELLNNLDKMSVDHLNLNADEKSYTDATKYSGLNVTPNLLSSEEAKKIDDVVTSDYQQFRKLEIGIPIAKQQN